MCDQDHFENDRQEYEARGLVTRKQFGMMLGAGVAMMLPKVANAVAVTESDVNVKTPDGVADCYFVHPASGTAPGVLVWPDIFGLRPAFRQMGKRLAESGLFGAGGESVLPRQESSDGGGRRRNSDPAIDAAGARAERDHAHDRCEGIHRVAGRASAGRQEPKDGHARAIAWAGRLRFVPPRPCPAAWERSPRSMAADW